MSTSALGLVLGLFFWHSTMTTARADAPLPELESSIEHGKLRITPPPGHHFNEEAPASVEEEGKKVSFNLAAQDLTAQLPASKVEQSVNVNLYVCDDAKTFCKKKAQSFKVPPVDDKEAKPSNAGAPSAKAAAPHLEASTGFYVNDPKKAFALAAKMKRPLIIEFFGIWCPPCNHLEAMVLHSPEFKKLTANKFVKLKLDADHSEFDKIKSKYKIQGLPSVVFATPEGDEIFRLLGYRPLDEVIATSNAAYKSRDEGFAQLAAKASGGNAEARYKAARIALDRDEPAKALEWLTPLKEMLKKGNDPRLVDLYRAELGVAQSSTDKDAVLRTLEAWLNDFPDSVDAIENYRALAELQESKGDKDASKKSEEKALSVIDRLAKAGPRALKGTEYSPADLAEIRADILEKQGDLIKTKAAYLACAKAFHAEALAEGSGYPRGPNLEQAYCLGKAGEVSKSEKIYREGIKRFPGEYTFYQGLAKLWLDAAKEPAKALPEAKKAVQFGYGNQKLKAMMTLARTYEALEKPEEAIKAIEAELADSAPETPTPGTLKLREKLRAKASELRAKLPRSTT